MKNLTKFIKNHNILHNIYMSQSQKRSSKTLTLVRRRKIGQTLLYRDGSYSGLDNNAVFGNI